MNEPLKTTLNKTLTEVGYAGLVTQCACRDAWGAIRTQADTILAVDLERPLVRQHPLRQNTTAKWPTRVSGFYPSGSVRLLQSSERHFDLGTRVNFCQTNETSVVLESVRELQDNLK